MSGDSDIDKSKGRRGPLIAGLGALLLIGAVYLAGYLFTGDRVPSGTSVSGVDIGGLSPAEAEDAIESELADWAVEPVSFEYGGSTYELDPRAVGLGLDVEETVHDAGAGRSWNPIRMADIIFGAGDDIEPVLTVDEAALSKQVAEIAEQVDTDPVEPEVTFKADGTARMTEPEVGLTVDQSAAVAAVLDRYLRTRGPIELPVTESEPNVGQREFDEAVEQQVEPATSAPVKLELPGRTVDLEVRHFARALSFAVSDGKLELTVDLERLERTAKGLLAAIGDGPTDATVELRNGEPVVVPDRPGVSIDLEKVADGLVGVLDEQGDARSIEVGTVTVQPEFTTRDARGLGIKRVVSSFVTYFPYAEYRNVNQARAAELISGTVLRPGETFSFNDTVGERTEANGFVKGFIIRNGVFAEDLGGGVSQVVTTTYNAAFFAGLKDIEHKPHSFYIDRYPLGREATVAWPSVDLKFQNDTPHGVLIEAWVVPSTPSSSGEMHVRMWSTKSWDIEAGVSDRYNFTTHDTRYDPTDECVATSGYGGFDVDVYRYFRKPGSSELHHKETQTVTYTPADTVICSAPPR